MAPGAVEVSPRPAHHLMTCRWEGAELLEHRSAHADGCSRSRLDGSASAATHTQEDEAQRGDHATGARAARRIGRNCASATAACRVRSGRAAAGSGSSAFAAFATRTAAAAFTAGPASAALAACSTGATATVAGSAARTCGAARSGRAARAGRTAGTRCAARSAGAARSRRALARLAGAIRARCTIGFGRVIADAEHRNARTHVVAFVKRGADDGVRPHARTGLARILLRAEVAVIAGLSVRSFRIVAQPRRRVACTGDVALIRRRAYDRVCPDACTGLAGIRLRACAAVIACGTVRRIRIVALARHRIARAYDVALIQRRTNHRVRPGTHARLARIALRAVAGIAARGAVGNVRIAALARHRITHARRVALIQRRARHRGPGACSGLAPVHLRAGIVVVTRGTVRKNRIGALTRRRRARTRGVARIERHAGDRVRACARTRQARIRLRTAIAIAARRPVRRIRIAALTRRRVARTRHVTSIERGANHRSPRARSRLAAIRRRTRIAVVARRAVRRVRIAALARRGITRTRHVTRIERRARDRVRSIARTRLATIRLRTRIVVVAAGAVRSIGIAALTRRGIAGTRHVTRIERRAGLGVRPGARTRLTRIRLRTTIVVAARRAIGRIRIAALTRRWIADTGHVTRIERRAGLGVRPIARTRHARIRLRTTIAVAARRTVGRIRIVALARRRIARTRHVTRIERGAGDRVCPGARSRLARIRLRTRIAIAARRTVRRVRIVAETRRRIACTRNVALIRRRAGHRVCPSARSRLARIRLRTGITIVA